MYKRVDPPAGAASASSRPGGNAAVKTGKPRQQLSAVKCLSDMLLQPANRMCAECRTHLADTSTIHASFTVEEGGTDNLVSTRENIGVGGGGVDRSSLAYGSNSSSHADEDGFELFPATGEQQQNQQQNQQGLASSRSDSGRAMDLSLAFRGNHELFAPPDPLRSTIHGSPTANARARSRKHDIRPPPHGVFLCQSCSLAHIKVLNQSITRIKPIQSGSTWALSEIDAMKGYGGNVLNRAVYERYVPPRWEEQRPKRGSSLVQREAWVLAKYCTLGFVLPNGPLFGDGSVGCSKYISDSHGGLSASTHSNAGTILPNRLVDYFCVVGHSSQLERQSLPGLAKVSKPSEMRFTPEVTDQYPSGTYGDGTELPAHLSRFVFPEGLRPRPKHLVPKLFAFVLTDEQGTRLYGTALHIYDQSITIDAFRDLVRKAASDVAAAAGEEGGKADLPAWLLRGDTEHIQEDDDEEDADGDASVASAPECIYFPKCLVLLSHYPFHDTFRAVIKHLYKLSLGESPLPIERFISNFVAEVPLPPQGKIEVRYHLTGSRSLTISRPPENRLPLARFGYRPLFSALSTGNIMVVIGILLQEGRVALCSRSYALLTPVAEALISLLFPFVYQGIYIPVLPYNMLDILDAPVPFMVGLNSKYLRSVAPSHRPPDVVFVDLDEDIVHLGVDNDGSQHSGDVYGRPIPPLPEKDATKLKSRLNECGGLAYLPPRCNIEGRISYGHGEHMPNSIRQEYSREIEWKGDTTRSEAAVLDRLDWAFLDDEDYRNGVRSFVTDTGTISDTVGSARSSQRIKGWKMKGVKKISPSKKGSGRNGAASPTSLAIDTAETSHLLEAGDETPDGFSAKGIREAFLRFFVSILQKYEKFVDYDNIKFLHDDFINDFDDDERAFISTFVKSQMFERYIEERIANPNQCEVRIFDESIVAKKNRSKKMTLVKGGKRYTPFLADDSGQIKEIYTPPAPSNWGLDGDRSYHYVSFPSLQSDLFGKIRAPKQWEQVSKRSRLVSSVAWGQQQLLSKVLMTTSSQPSLSNQTKDIDWAIHTLARLGEDGSIGEAEPSNDLQRAKNLLVSSKQKQNQAIAQIVKMQSMYRMHVAHKLVCRLRDEMAVSPEIREAVLETKTDFLVSAITCQRFFRGFKARKLAGTRSTAARRVQHWSRGVLIRQAYLQLVSSTTMVQSLARGRRTRFFYKLTLDTLALIQAQVRGRITRRNVTRLRQTRAHYYRLQLFELWRHTRTPLAYRSSFWDLIRGSGFLHFSMIQKELERCWDLLNVDFSSLADGNSPSMATTQYHRYLLVEEQLEAVRPKKERVQETYAKLVPCFPSERPGTLQRSSDIQKAQLIHQASEQLTLERIRIYERLCTLKKNKSVLRDIYGALAIPMDAKLKKRTFAEEIWTWMEHADQSAALFFSLFPESKGRIYIQPSTAPTSKAKKRFGKLASYQPSTLHEEAFVACKRDALIKTDLREIVLALMIGTQSLWIKMNAGHLNEKSTSHFLRQRDAVASRFTCWEDEKYNLIRKFLYGEGPPKTQSER